jgi:PIN domain nuclease of toxin-antitoxin system
MRVLLDTHILIRWCSDPESLNPAQQHALAQIGDENPALVADISLWEVATLVELRKIELQFPVREWLNRAVAPPLVRVVPITANIAGELTGLSDWPHRDPADRLIVATARVFGATLLTDDRRIREAGLVAVV